MNGSGWEGQFAQGFSSGGAEGAWVWVVVVLVVLAAIVGLYYLLNRPSSTKAARPQRVESHRLATTDSSRPGTKDSLAPRKANALVTRVEVPQGRLNPLQHRMLHELIDAFRDQEPAAQALPVALLEKYSEFLYENLKQLRTNDADVREFVNVHYPLKVGYRAELDFHDAGVTQLIQSQVVEVGPQTVTVAYEGPVLPFIKRGANLWLNYTVGKHFLQGATTIAEVRTEGGLVLRRPAQVTLTTERRYVRIPLVNVQGTLQDPKRGWKSVVKVLDLSLEGVRVQVERPLEKKNVHQLAFDLVIGGRGVNLGPIDCVPSKAFLNGSGTYEAGLVFLYLDSVHRNRLAASMKALAQELQERAVSR